MKDFIGFIILGLIAGALGKLLMPGKDGGGLIATTLLGIGGAVLGGWLGKFLPILTSTSNNGYIPGWGSIITATLGAFLLLFIFKQFKKRK